MQASNIKGFVNALSMFIVGMAFMSRFYCIELGITSGSMYIGWDTVLFVVAGLVAIQVLIHFDPSFKEEEVKPKRRIVVVSKGRRV